MLVDISIDQGGCFATSQETPTPSPPTSSTASSTTQWATSPARCPGTSTYALTNATMRYTVALAGGVEAGISRHPELVGGVNVVAGALTNQAVAHAASAGPLSPWATPTCPRLDGPPAELLGHAPEGRSAQAQQ